MIVPQVATIKMAMADRFAGQFAKANSGVGRLRPGDWHPHRVIAKCR
ncbi:MAG: hypothetical protein CM1200mP29_13750 [Verrucomicrobiota bacterium]|nr:MAG: hypothetical protein CM1200mP29_13750 [Verrucomicrobiota bacterium]